MRWALWKRLGAGEADVASEKLAMAQKAAEDLVHTLQQQHAPEELDGSVLVLELAEAGRVRFMVTHAGGGVLRVRPP